MDERFSKQFVEIVKDKKIYIILAVTIYNTLSMTITPPKDRGLSTFYGDYGFMAPFVGIYLLNPAIYAVLSIMVNIFCTDKFKDYTFYKENHIKSIFVRLCVVNIVGVVITIINAVLGILVRNNQSKHFYPDDVIMTQYTTKIMIYVIVFLLISAFHITISFFISLIARSMMWSNLICIIITAFFGMWGANRTVNSQILPAGMSTYLIRYAVADNIISMQIFTWLVIEFAITICVACTGMIVYRKRCR